MSESRCWSRGSELCSTLLFHQEPDVCGVLQHRANISCYESLMLRLWLDCWSYRWLYFCSIHNRSFTFIWRCPECVNLQEEKLLLWTWGCETLLKSLIELLLWAELQAAGLSTVNTRGRSAGWGEEGLPSRKCSSRSMEAINRHSIRRNIQTVKYIPAWWI